MFYPEITNLSKSTFTAKTQADPTSAPCASHGSTNKLYLIILIFAMLMVVYSFKRHNN